MTEADFKSIWDHPDVDDTRWSNVGVRIAEILNFHITGDATSQITNTAVTPMLEQLSEEIFLELVAAAKIAAVTNPWDFIQSRVVNITSKKIRENKQILQDIRDKLYGRFEMRTVNLPDTNNRTY